MNHIILKILLFLFLYTPYAQAQFKLPKSHISQHNTLIKNQTTSHTAIHTAIHTMNPTYVTIYYVDRDDYELDNITYDIIPQKDADTEYKTMVLVYDRFRDEIIGGSGSYSDTPPTNAEFKEIINNAIMDLYNGKRQIRCSEAHPLFDGILGLYWGMNIEHALNHLKSMALTNVHQVPNKESLLIINEVYWNGMKFDFLNLSYMVSNKQKKYLGEISFCHILNSSTEAKNFRNNIYRSISQEFDKEDIQGSLNQDGFKSFTIYQKIGKIKFGRININITKLDGNYVVSLKYNGWMDISPLIINDK